MFHCLLVWMQTGIEPLHSLRKKTKDFILEKQSPCGLPRDVKSTFVILFQQFIYSTCQDLLEAPTGSVWVEKKVDRVHLATESNNPSFLSLGKNWCNLMAIVYQRLSHTHTCCFLPAFLFDISIRSIQKARNKRRPGEQEHWRKSKRNGQSVYWERKAGGGLAGTDGVWIFKPKRETPTSRSCKYCLIH